jgi:hypothetical protein
LRAVFVFDGEGRWTNPLGFDKIVWNDFGQPKAGLRASEGSSQGRDEQSHPLRQKQKWPLAGLFCF